MEIKILRKKYPANLKNKENTVNFEIDGKEFSVNIFYMNGPTIGRRNVFIDDRKFQELKDYIESHYNFNFNDFANNFFYELRKYSKGRNLDIVKCKTLNKEE